MEIYAKCSIWMINGSDNWCCGPNDKGCLDELPGAFYLKSCVSFDSISSSVYETIVNPMTVIRVYYRLFLKIYFNTYDRFFHIFPVNKMDKMIMATNKT